MCYVYSTYVIRLTAQNETCARIKTPGFRLQPFLDTGCRAFDPRKCKRPRLFPLRPGLDHDAAPAPTKAVPTDDDSSFSMGAVYRQETHFKVLIEFTNGLPRCFDGICG